MPSAQLELQSRERPVALVEIQGFVNVGDRPLVPTELDLESQLGDGEDNSHLVQHGEIIELGALQTEVDFMALEPDKPVELVIGEHQLLRGTVEKLKTPLAVLKMNRQGPIPVLQVITHRLVFSKRPEPVIQRK